MEDQWQDSEEELEALELLARADESLMLEYNMMKSGLVKKTPGNKETGSGIQPTGRTSSSKKKKTTPSNLNDPKKKKTPSPPPSKRMKTRLTPAKASRQSQPASQPR